MSYTDISSCGLKNGKRKKKCVCLLCRKNLSRYCIYPVILFYFNKTVLKKVITIGKERSPFSTRIGDQYCQNTCITGGDIPPMWRNGELTESLHGAGGDPERAAEGGAAALDPQLHRREQSRDQQAPDGAPAPGQLTYII